MLAHQTRVEQWTQPRLHRRKLGQKHPVDDFLFEYYKLTPGKLRQWHPGHLVAMLDVPDDLCASYAGSAEFLVDLTSGTVQADKSRFERRAGPVRRSVEILQRASGRAAKFSCFGMHEWAMVYGTDPAQIRHSDEQLRLPPAQIKGTPSPASSS